MASQYERQGLEFAAHAVRKLRSFSFFNRRGKYEEAAELYVKSANCWKRAKKWKEASDSFHLAANNYLQFESKYDAASVYVKASHCLKKMSLTEDVIKALSNAVELFTDEGRFSIAAKHQKEIAELYESIGDLEKAVTAYEIAAEYFEGEGSMSSGHSCLLKMAPTCALLENYTKSAEIFERVAAESVDNDLLKWSVKEYLLKAGICLLCAGDIVACKKALDKYCTLSVEFNSTREYQLLSALVAAVENYNVKDFATASQEYNSIIKLDQWKTSLLLKVRKSIAGDGENSGESDEIL